MRTLLWQSRIVITEAALLRRSRYHPLQYAHLSPLVPSHVQESSTVSSLRTRKRCVMSKRAALRLANYFRAIGHRVKIRRHIWSGVNAVGRRNFAPLALARFLPSSGCLESLHPRTHSDISEERIPQHLLNRTGREIAAPVAQRLPKRADRQVTLRCILGSR
jgi:hypothetical protein